MNWFLLALKRYAVFSGRSRRSEFWMFMLFYVAIVFVLAVVDLILGKLNSKVGIGLISGVVGAALIIPSVAVTARRLHDIGLSGWWQLITFIPFGALILLALMIKDSTPASNKYGPNPKASQQLDGSL